MTPGVLLPPISVIWTRTAPVDTTLFEKAVVDYLIAFLSIGTPFDFSSLDSEVFAESGGRTLFTGVAYFDGEIKPTEEDLENLLIVHFVSRGTDALESHLANRGLAVESVGVEVGGYGTSPRVDTSLENSDDGGDDTKKWVILIAAVSAAGILTCLVLVSYVVLQRQKMANIDDEQRHADNGGTHHQEVREVAPDFSGNQSIFTTSESIDQSLFTTD
jgi:hypothetical protein